MGNNGKVIKGKRYNPDKSVLLCQTPYGYLYQKKGAHSFYLASRNRLNYEPVTYQRAEELIKVHGTWKQHQELFTVSTSKKRTSIDLTQEDYSILKMLSGIKGMSTRGYLHSIIRDRYKAHQRKSKRD